MEKGGKKLIVSAIENGTVFDHIPANQLFKVISILGLQDCQNQVTFGTNLDSKLLGIPHRTQQIRLHHKGIGQIL